MNTRQRLVSSLLCAVALTGVLAVVLAVAAAHPRPTVDLPLAAFFATGTAAIALGWAAEIHLRGLLTERVLILGTGPTASLLIEEIESQRAPRYMVAGVVDHIPPTDGPMACRWLGRFAELADIMDRVRPSHIVLAGDNRRAHLPFETLLHSRVRGVLVEDALDFYERLTGTVAIEALTPGRLVLSNGFRNGGRAQATARAVNVIAAAIGLILVAPLFALIAVAIKLDSRGPVFFVQRRTGRDDIPFSLVKFRTMHPCDERRSEWARDNEDRITRLGAWLRRFRLDELPQLVNVVRGEMNVIGPRPHPVCNSQLFNERIAFYALRSAVLPGITGWAQVRYGYANTLEEETEKMRYDLYYIKNRSVWLDGRIVLQTIGLMLWGEGPKAPRSPRRRLASRSKTRRSGARAMPVVRWNGTGTASVGRP